MQRNEGGFTLLEILLSLAILSLVVVAAVKNSGTTISNSQYLREKTFAHWVAMNKATEQRLARKWPPTGKTNGKIKLADINWNWLLEVKKTEDSNMRKAEVSVTRVDGGQEPLSILQFYIGRPMVQ